MMRKKERVMRRGRKRKEKNKERKGERDKKAMCLSCPHFSDTLLERHCFLKRGFFSQSKSQMNHNLTLFGASVPERES